MWMAYIHAKKLEADSDQYSDSDDEYPMDVYWEQTNGGRCSIKRGDADDDAGWPAGWYIEDSGNKCAYTAPGATDDLPVSGWKVYDGPCSIPGLLPAPTIVAVAI